MPEQTFGGDDTGGNAPAASSKKPSFARFGLSPDVNIRDLFWQIMSSYATTKKPGIDLASLEQDRFALMNTSISVLSSPHSSHYGLSSKFICTYSLMLFMDGGWSDALSEFLLRSYENDSHVKKSIIVSIKNLMKSSNYRQALISELMLLLRGGTTNAVALWYLSSFKDPSISNEFKKELVIFARGDIGENQLNAISALEIIAGADDDVQKTLISILSHWDSNARLAAASVLNDLDSNAQIIDAAKKRLPLEMDDQVRKILVKLAK